jgi:phosphoserine aminotransferase
MISFYPGPSRIHDEIPRYTKDAHRKGILSLNHRSDDFMKISENVIGLLKQKLNIPKDYTIFYTSSATECWEIIAQSLITQKSYHLYNGAFGQKWFDYTKRICAGAENFSFQHNEVLHPAALQFGTEGIICITHNETSNGTQVSTEIIRTIKKNNPNHLVAIDATSSMGGVNLDFAAADIWLASVQKCFGLPAGLGLMMCSPAAIECAKKINERNHYNSLSFMTAMMEKWQTPFTPNVLNIYLLMRVMEKAKHIDEIHKKTENRYHQWMDYFENKKTLRHLVENEEVRSFTVVPITATDELVTTLKLKARRKGIVLGEGYGELKTSTFRIANFPAIKKKEIKLLKEFLSRYK